jgi:hypothetical protein
VKRQVEFRQADLFTFFTFHFFFSEIFFRSMNMNKREVVWLIVKLIGVYFIYLSVVSAFSLISSVSTLYSISSQISTTKPDANSTFLGDYAGRFPGRPPVPANKTNEKPVVDAAQKKLADEAIKTVLFYVFLTIPLRSSRVLSGQGRANFVHTVKPRGDSRHGNKGNQFARNFRRKKIIVFYDLAFLLYLSFFFFSSFSIFSINFFE